LRIERRQIDIMSRTCQWGMHRLMRGEVGREVSMRQVPPWNPDEDGR
jgi:hypothetical protein